MDASGHWPSNESWGNTNQTLNLRFRHQIKPDFKHQGIHIDFTWDMPSGKPARWKKNMAREFAVGRIDVHLSFLIYDEYWWVMYNILVARFDHKRGLQLYRRKSVAVTEHLKSWPNQVQNATNWGFRRFLEALFLTRKNSRVFQPLRAIPWLFSRSMASPGHKNVAPRS